MKNENAVGEIQYDINGKNSVPSQIHNRIVPERNVLLNMKLIFGRKYYFKYKPDFISSLLLNWRQKIHCCWKEIEIDCNLLSLLQKIFLQNVYTEYSFIYRWYVKSWRENVSGLSFI